MTSTFILKHDESHGHTYFVFIDIGLHIRRNSLQPMLSEIWLFKGKICTITWVTTELV